MAEPEALPLDLPSPDAEDQERQQDPPESKMSPHAAQLAAGRVADEPWKKRIPWRFWDVDVEKLDEPVRLAVDEWFLNPYRNVLFIGPVGVGKTYGLCAMAKEAFLARWTVLFYPTVELLEDLRDRSDDRRARQVLEKASSVDLLVLDDLGREKPSEWTAERLYLIVNRRWLDGKPTLSSSNFDPQAGGDAESRLVQTIGKQTYSRLSQGAIRLRLQGPDRRAE